MAIAIIGAGNVGMALANAFTGRGELVKAFNTTGAENMENAHYPQGNVFMRLTPFEALR